MSESGDRSETRAIVARLLAGVAVAACVGSGLAVAVGDSDG